MTLRLRLTLFYVLLLGLVLGGLGLFLRYALRSALYGALDATLQDALLLAHPLVNEEEGRFRLEGERGALPADLALYLVVGGQVVARQGPVFPPPPRLQAGCFSHGEVRYCVLPGEGYRLVAARSLEWADRAMDRVERVLFLGFSGALALAFLLGYLLSGRALAPLGRMARRALELAQAPDPRARLPEPGNLDEVGRFARAQNLLLASLERLLESEKRFVRHAAHELRTPLTALIGRLEQALEADPPPRRPLERALEAALHLKYLSERLLLLARADAPLRREPLDLVGVVLEALEDLPKEGKALELDLPPTLPHRGDPDLLRALARNLLENAFRHARTRVAVRLEPGPCLVVEDDGPGIPPQKREEVFKPFRRFSSGEGSGLGLALVRRVAEAHGGFARAEESPLGGARVRVCLNGRVKG
ncbi:HAMP domain-containing sensor histidine kinase [Thermus sp. FJN-A]